MVVGVCRVSLMLEESPDGALREKRAILRKIKDRVHQKFNCAIAEVGDPDDLQVAQLGFAVVSNQRAFTQSMVQKILAFIDDLAVAKLSDDEQDYIDYGDDEELAASGDYSHWEPEEPSPPVGRGALRAPKAPASSSSSDYPWDPDPTST